MELASCTHCPKAPKNARNTVSARDLRLGWLKHERCGLGVDRTALNSPVKKLLNAGEQVACGAANGGTPQVASKPPEVAIHCERRNIAKLRRSIGGANRPCDIALGCLGCPNSDISGTVSSNLREHSPLTEDRLRIYGAMLRTGSGSKRGWNSPHYRHVANG